MAFSDERNRRYLTSVSIQIVNSLLIIYLILGESSEASATLGREFSQQVPEEPLPRAIVIEESQNSPQQPGNSASPAEPFQAQTSVVPAEIHPQQPGNSASPVEPVQAQSSVAPADIQPQQQLVNSASPVEPVQAQLSVATADIQLQQQLVNSASPVEPVKAQSSVVPADIQPLQQLENKTILSKSPVEPVAPANEQQLRPRSSPKAELPRYVHPNANANGGTSRSNEPNWRSGNGQLSEVIREPRGPPTPVNGTPQGFQRGAPTELVRQQERSKQQPPPLATSILKILQEPVAPPPTPTIQGSQEQFFTPNASLVSAISPLASAVSSPAVVSFKPVVVQPIPVPLSPQPPQKELKYPTQTALDNSIQTVAVAYSSNQSELYCQLVEFFDPLDNMMEKMSVVYAGNNPYSLN